VLKVRKPVRNGKGRKVSRCPDVRGAELIYIFKWLATHGALTAADTTGIYWLEAP
jgi:hypothetical protein